MYNHNNIKEKKKEALGAEKKPRDSRHQICDRRLCLSSIKQPRQGVSGPQPTDKDGYVGHSPRGPNKLSFSADAGIEGTGPRNVLNQSRDNGEFKIPPRPPIRRPPTPRPTETGLRDGLRDGLEPKRPRRNLNPEFDEVAQESAFNQLIKKLKKKKKKNKNKTKPVCFCACSFGTLEDSFSELNM